MSSPLTDIANALVENQPDLAQCKDLEAKIAVSLLMSHIIPADGKVLDCETDRLSKLAIRRFGISQPVVDDFIRLTEFNRKPVATIEALALEIKANYCDRQLKSVIRDLWNIALVDDELHAYEEALIYSVADSLGLSRRDVISEQSKVCN